MLAFAVSCVWDNKTHTRVFTLRIYQLPKLLKMSNFATHFGVVLLFNIITSKNMNKMELFFFQQKSILFYSKVINKRHDKFKKILPIILSSFLDYLQAENDCLILSCTSPSSLWSLNSFCRFRSWSSNSW